jgi:hypothetical protein
MNATATKILEIMRIHNLGRENAETRIRIEARLQNFNDRGVRNAYSDVPLCSCEDGLFLPIRPEEVDEYETYLRRKKMSEDLISIKIRRIRATWPELKPRPKMVQVELFPRPEVWR